MTKAFRVILRIPTALTFEVLSPEQQAAIQSVFGQFVMPMPGTIEAGGWKLCDAVTGDNFDPARMSLYGFNWPILGMWDDSGLVHAPFDAATFQTHLPDGEPLHEPHRWAGWPKAF